MVPSQCIAAAPPTGTAGAVKAAAKLAAGTGASVVVERCQSCGAPDLQTVLFLGYLPAVNQLQPVGERIGQRTGYPGELLYCRNCTLVQLGLVVDPAILFPPDYPYISGVTRSLHENFADLARESADLLGLKAGDLVIDIGSNDGTLLSNFQAQGQRVQGIEPTDTSKLAIAAGIPTEAAFFGRRTGAALKAKVGTARLITATSAFAHIEDPHGTLDSVFDLLDADGVFVVEVHYLMSLLETLQYDSIYHEQLCHYTVGSIQHLLGLHGIEVIFARKIPTHGGSIRVYAARTGTRPVHPAVAALLGEERTGPTLPERLVEFRQRAVMSKLNLYRMLRELKVAGSRIYGVSAPSRACTLITYAGLNGDILDCMLELPGSFRIGKYMPGTMIQIEDERRLFNDPPDCAVMFSWHLADELMPKLRKKGYRGAFLIPLPEPRLVRD